MRGEHWACTTTSAVLWRTRTTTPPRELRSPRVGRARHGKVVEAAVAVADFSVKTPDSTAGLTEHALTRVNFAITRLMVIKKKPLSRIKWEGAQDFAPKQLKNDIKQITQITILQNNYLTVQWTEIFSLRLIPKDLEANITYIDNIWNYVVILYRMDVVNK